MSSSQILKVPFLNTYIGWNEEKIFSYLQATISCRYVFTCFLVALLKALVLGQQEHEVIN